MTLFCLECRSLTTFPHDHRDGYGLDDGLPLRKRDQVAARRIKAKALRDQGLKQDTIADLIGVSRPTIVADLKA